MSADVDAAREDLLDAFVDWLPEERASSLIAAFEAAIRAAALDEARAALLENATPGDDYDGTWSCIAAIDALRRVTA